MPDKKVAVLTQITTVEPYNDFLPIVDVDDPTMAISGTTKKITPSQLLQSGVPLVVPQGSQAAPSISFSSDSNTGIYSPTGDQVSISAGGSGTLTVNNTGLSIAGATSISGNLAVDTSTLFVDSVANRVGVGTVTPAGRLSSAGETGQSGFNAGTLTSPIKGNLWYETDGSGWKFQIGKWQSSTFTPQMTFQDNGNVGIGTATPDTQLHVKGTGSQTISVERDGATIAGRLDIISGNSTNLLRATTAKPLVFEQGTGVFSMTLDASGRLGIGTATPSALLTANGNVDFSSSNTVRGTMWFNANALELQANSNASSGLALKTTSGTPISFYTNGTLQATLDSSGNLGLGTVSAGGALEIKRGASLNALIEISGNNNTGGTASFAVGQLSDNSAVVSNRANASIIFGTNNSGKMFLDASGRLIRGGATADTLTTDSATMVNIGNFAVQNAATTGTYLTIKPGAANGTVDIAADARTGAYPALRFLTSATPQMTLDSSGNLGLGVTPSAWGGTFRAIQLGRAATWFANTTSNESAFTNNARWDGSNYIFIQNGWATRVVSDTAGKTQWGVSNVSGTAGQVVSWITPMTLDASGRLGIGTSAPTSTLHVVGTANITGNFSAPNGDVASSIRAAASDYAGVAFDGATAFTRVASTTTTQPISIGDFSVWIRCKIPATSSANQDPLFTLGSTSGGDGSGAYGIVFRVFTSTNLVNLLIRDSSGSASGAGAGNATATFTYANYAGQVVDFVITRIGSTIAIYANGNALSVAYTNQSNFANPIGDWPTATTQYFGVGASTTNPYRDAIYRAVLFNRALSAADVVDLIETGVSPADQWGTQTQLANTTTNNGGFETAGAGGADVVANWQEYTAGTASIIRDTTDYSPDLGSTASAKMTGTDGTAVSSLYNTGISQFVAGKRYRIRAAHKRSSAATISWKTAAGNVALTSFSVTTAWANYSGEFVMPTNEFVKIDTSGTSSLWIDNVIYERIGAIVDLDFTKGIGSVAYDRSTNNLDGTLVGGVSWTYPKTQPVVLEAGSTSAPSLTISGDTNTGLYFPAADTLALAVGGSDAIYINSSRNVGIGTPTISAKLHVEGAAFLLKNGIDVPYLQVAGRSTDGRAEFNFLNNGLSVVNAKLVAYTGILAIETNGFERLRIAADGTATFSGPISMGSGHQIRATDGSNSNPGVSFSSDQNTGLVSAAADTIAVVTGGAERARVDNNGNVVVGTGVLATNATNGFLYIPSCAGTPTGTPTAYSGRVPLVWDSTNNILYIRSGGSWKPAYPPA